MIGLLYVILIVGVLVVVAKTIDVLANKRAVGSRRARAQLVIAQRSLRKIANNTAGNNSLEAQVALDEIDNLYDVKELS